MVMWGLFPMSQPGGIAVPATHPLSPPLAKNTRVPSTSSKELHTRVDGAEPAGLGSLGTETCEHSPSVEQARRGVTGACGAGLWPFPGRCTECR